jgi:hypothetical protein
MYLRDSYDPQKKQGTKTGCGQNNGNTKKLGNIICDGYIERTSVGNTEYSSVCLRSVVFVSVH